MSTTIITNQTAIKFNIRNIIDGLQNDKTTQSILSLLDITYAGAQIFKTWEDEYIFLIEEYIESNLHPQIPRWNAFLPVSTENDIIYGYIKNALTAFEGGMCRFKGSNHTKPESALRKLRNTLEDATDFEHFIRFNPSGLHFTFDMQEDIDNKAKAIIDMLGFDLLKAPYNNKTSPNDIGFIKYNIRVTKVSDIAKVIIIHSLSTQTRKVSCPRYQSESISKITKSLLTKLNIA